jgi:hypothetical protein
MGVRAPDQMDGEVALVTGDSSIARGPTSRAGFPVCRRG